MISVFRRQLEKNKLYKGIFWLVIIAMLGLWSLPGIIKSPTGSGAWGTINGRSVMRDDFNRKVVAFEEQMRMIRMQYGQYADQIMEAMGMDINPTILAYDSLIKENLINDVVDDLHIQVHRDSVQQALGNILTTYQELAELIPMTAINPRDGSINEKELRKHLRRLNLSMSDFDEKLEQALGRKLASNLISAASYVPQFEIKSEYDVLHRPKTFSVLSIPKSEIAAEVKKDTISDADIQAFFERKNKRGAYWVPEKRSVRMWTITPQAYGATVSDEDIEKYYENNKVKQFVAEPAKVQVRKIFLRAYEESNMQAVRDQAVALGELLEKSPNNFAAKAVELSADIETAKDGGLMKPFAKGDSSIDRSIERAAFLLKKEGDISQPITVKDGVVLLQLVEKTPRTFKELKDVHKEILDTLINQKFAKRFVADMKGIYTSKDDDVQLKEMIAQKGGSPIVKELISNDGSPLARVAFSVPVNDYTFYVDGKDGYIVLVTRIQERHLPELDSIRATVKADLINERTDSLLAARLEQAEKEALSKSLSDIASSYRGVVKKVENVDVTNSERIDTLRKQGLPVDDMLQIEKVGMITAARDENHGYIVRLDELAPFNQESFEEKRQSLIDRISGERRNLLGNGFVASLHRNATINLDA